MSLDKSTVDTATSPASPLSIAIRFVSSKYYEAVAASTAAENAAHTARINAGSVYGGYAVDENGVDIIEDENTLTLKAALADVKEATARDISSRRESFRDSLRAAFDLTDEDAKIKALYEACVVYENSSSEMTGNVVSA